MVASAKITIRLTDGEARILRSQAIRGGLSLSAFARRQILHGSTVDAAPIEGIVSQILPVVDARFDQIEETIQAIRSAITQSEERTSDRLKKAVQFLVERKNQ